MAFYRIHTRSWTLFGLIGAFIDLALAYFLLCVSGLAFLPGKFCNSLGLYLPCPCTGFFGYQNHSLCWHKLLIDWPRRKIFFVQMLIKSSFPFDLILFDHQSRYLDILPCSDRIYDRGVPELENEEPSSSFSSPKLQNLVDRESGFDAKGKKIVNQKQRYGTRRRKRSALAYGKSSSKQSVVADASSSAYNGTDIRTQISGEDYSFQDDGNAANVLDLGEKTWDNFEQNGLFGKNKVTDDDLSSVEKFISNAHNIAGKAGNQENMIRILEEALKKEKAACAALQSELENERAASATAADEAMAMILRLQADKAAIEMEARQYQRMIEEQFAYEEEEMNVLKEILVRRERENHFLEKEIEAYRKINGSENGHLEVSLSCMTSEFGQKPLHSPVLKEDTSPLLQDIEKGKSIGKNANWPSTHEAASAELTSEAIQNCSGIEEIFSCCDKLEKDGQLDNLHKPILDSEPMIYDVHVIDDKTELQKEKNLEENGILKCAATDFGFSSGELVSDCLSITIGQTNESNHRNSPEIKNGLPVLGNSQSKSLLVDSASSCSSAASGERLKIETEVELLRERLRMVQEGKEKMNFSAEQREKINSQLKLVEDMLNQVREIQ